MDRYRNTCSESESDSDSDKHDTQSSDGEVEMLSSDRPNNKVNNVWSKLLDEEVAVNQVNAVSMTSRPENSQNRQCEAYDYTNKLFEPESDDEQEVLRTTIEEDELDLFKCDNQVPDCDDSKLFTSRIGKRSKCNDDDARDEINAGRSLDRKRCRMRDRLGKGFPEAEEPEGDGCKIGKTRTHKSVKGQLGKFQTVEEHMEGSDVFESAESSSISEFIETLCEKLNEPKKHLMRRVVETVGTDKAVCLLGMTEDIQESGGLMTNDGRRRRTAGGIFLMLLKSDKDISKTKINRIFADENKVLLMKKKQQDKLRRKRKMRFLQNLNSGSSMHGEQVQDGVSLNPSNDLRSEIASSVSNDNNVTNEEDMEPGEIKD